MNKFILILIFLVSITGCTHQIINVYCPSYEVEEGIIYNSINHDGAILEFELIINLEDDILVKEFINITNLQFKSEDTPYAFGDYFSLKFDHDIYYSIYVNDVLVEDINTILNSNQDNVVSISIDLTTVENLNYEELLTDIQLELEINYTSIILSSNNDI